MATVTDSFTWTIQTPAVGGYAGPKLPVAATATEISGFVVGGTDCDFNIEERSACNSAGTNIMESDLTVDADGATTSTFTNAGLAEDCFLWLDVSETTAAGTCLSVTISYTYTI